MKFELIILNPQATETKEESPNVAKQFQYRAMRNKPANQSNDFSNYNEIFIGNLRHFITKYQVGDHFQQYGNVEDVFIKQSVYRRNFGFVLFEDAESVERVFGDLVSLLLFKCIKLKKEVFILLKVKLTLLF